MVVQRSPEIVKGPYLDLQLAKDELKEIAKNGKSRAILEIIDGSVQFDPHKINGIPQTLANGFDKYWSSWGDITTMYNIVEKYMGKRILYIIRPRRLYIYIYYAEIKNQ